MKAISPVRSFRINSANLSEHSLGISRSKSPVDDPLSLLYNMNDCYSKLKELVPSIPQNKNVSKMEILQHVIDYILDLQIALDSGVAITTTTTVHHHNHQHQNNHHHHHHQNNHHHHHPRPGGTGGQGGQGGPAPPTRTPLTALNTDISILSLQSPPELPSERTDDSSRTQHR
ncbi:hypothetical protein NHX12_020074 [Muraenolepis orangiensis]|uniref:DNA-binding protein inhibitor ID-4 n=1 Tax=Muraenolepis orangiensis TaxID=630683 RepID=A0A9Q0IXS7_9TELE|nr:hypothetical protein NHX12_020074 [Muraenolepis orangiensis]